VRLPQLHDRDSCAAYLVPDAGQPKVPILPLGSRREEQLARDFADTAEYFPTRHSAFTSQSPTETQSGSKSDAGTKPTATCAGTVVAVLKADAILLIATRLVVMV
jgi:hypothetical protein